jgi:Leucine-rich repeat (LRR) protein
MTIYAFLLSLDLANHELTSIPPEIGGLKNLWKLYLSGNKLTSLPEEIGQLTELVDLCLHGNKLSTLPRGIGKLTKLTSPSYARGGKFQEFSGQNR